MKEIREKTGRTFTADDGSAKTPKAPARRILTVQDLSCIGKCSLTVALPVISALGVETAVLPTALLSTHTMFRDPERVDLTDEISPITEHWKREGFRFDAIYTGYLASERQIDAVAEVIRDFRPDIPEDGFVLVDPAMADNGKLYTGFDDAFAKKMATLTSAADIILPNLTEASLLTGIPYQKKAGRDDAIRLLRALTASGARNAVLTGVTPDSTHTGVMAMKREDGSIFEYYTEQVPASYHGTGDLFASVVSGSLLRGKTLPQALTIACDFTASTIRLTRATHSGPAYGVEFEALLPELMRAI